MRRGLPAVVIALAFLIGSGGSASIQALSSSPGALGASLPSTETGGMEPIAALKSYRYSVRARFTGAEAKTPYDNFKDSLTLPPFDGTFAFEMRGVVTGPMQTQYVFTAGSNTVVTWLRNDRFERRQNNDPVDTNTGPFDEQFLDDYSLFPTEFYWNRAIGPWFDANRATLNCKTSALTLNSRPARDCSFSGLPTDEAFVLLDRLGHGSFQSYSTFNIEVVFMPSTNTPIRLVIIAEGKDANGALTGIEFAMELSDIDSPTLALPPAPSTRR